MTKDKPIELLTETRYLLRLYNQIITTSPMERITVEIKPQKYETRLLFTIQSINEVISLYQSEIENRFSHVQNFVELVMKKYNKYRINKVG